MNEGEGYEMKLEDRKEKKEEEEEEEEEEEFYLSQTDFFHI